MKKRFSERNNPQSSDAQNLCIWMTAGVISYKLCPLNYDCEHCELDQAMHSEVRSRKISSKVKTHRPETLTPKELLPRSKEDSEKSLLFFTFSVGEVAEGIYLHPTHLWVRRIDGNQWRIGVDELLAYVLPCPTKLEFFDLDKTLVQDQVFARVLTDAGVVFLTIPLSGRLVQTNSRLAQRPELIQEDPYGEGWLAVIDWSQDHLELEKFHTRVGGKQFLEQEACHLKFLLRHRGVEVEQIGKTLGDGGVSIKYLHQILAPEVCLRLTIELMVTGKQTW